MMKLLIVESPGKLKTLRKILGREWVLEASVGHTTELAHDGYKNLGFDILDDHIATRYVPRGDRGQQVLSKLRACVRQADEVYLAMDPDREGEAIAWHLAEQLRLKRYSRVTYTAVTESAVKAAIKAPRQLDFPLIHAQRARQCLDKLVGYEVSPLLWNTTGGKSAGRVQSATLHIVCERERERLAFVPQDYWTLHSHYEGGLVARYEPAKKIAAAKEDENSGRVDTREEAERIEQIARTSAHVVTQVTEREDKRLPPPPFITSSLQQMASVRLKMSPEKSMRVAQELYEGIGGTGLITYMRTDAISLSPEFVSDARSWLAENRPEALPDHAPAFRTKAGAQAAHEAIRPTSVALTPEVLRDRLNADQFALYRLIWERAVASQCKVARLAKTLLEIHAGETRWITRGLRVIDPGYLAFWKNIEDERELPPLTQGQTLPLKDLKVEKKTTQPPPRYSEAKLVQLMESLGIGRPSTYASTVKTLRDRAYVEIDSGGALAPTPVGMASDDVLAKSMPDLVDVGFTARMEESLDQIADNKLDWERFLIGWNSDYFRSALSKANALIRTMPKMDFPASPSAPRPSFEGRARSFASTARSGGAARGATSGARSSAAPRSPKKSAAATAPRMKNGQTFSVPARTVRSGSKGKTARGKKTHFKGAGKNSRGAGKRSVASAPLEAADAPLCEQGHGPLQPRVSKKGDGYWKCGHAGCDSWVWPGRK